MVEPATQRAREYASNRVLWPLFAAGFITAFGSHGVAANLGAGPGGLGDHLLTLGILLALYDGAEIVLKPVFGALADRVGLRPVLLGGLAAFALASVVFVVVDNPALLGVARFAQGAAASAFSPAAGALIARIGPPRRSARAFGSYGAWKSLGYTAGPLLGGALVAVGGYPWLFGVLAALAGLVLAWAALSVPAPDPLPRNRQTLADLARRLTDRGFLPPTIALAASAAALSCAVGFLPVVGLHAGLSPVVTGAVVSVLALTASASQPLVGRLHDRGRLGDRVALTAGTLITAAGLVLPALLPGLAGLLGAALLVGIGTGLITPVGFAVLAATSPPERLGQTMGSAELGREAGEAGGPLLTGAVAALAGLAAGFLAIATAVALTTGTATTTRTTRPTEADKHSGPTPASPRSSRGRSQNRRFPNERALRQGRRPRDDLGDPPWCSGAGALARELHAGQPIDDAHQEYPTPTSRALKGRVPRALTVAPGGGDGAMLPCPLTFVRETLSAATRSRRSCL